MGKQIKIGDRHKMTGELEGVVGRVVYIHPQNRYYTVEAELEPWDKFQRKIKVHESFIIMPEKQTDPDDAFWDENGRIAMSTRKLSVCERLLRPWRKSHGYTLADAGRIFGISKSTISQYETGSSTCRNNTVINTLLLWEAAGCQ